MAEPADALWFEDPDVDPGAVDLVAELGKLTALHRQGVLDSSEFEALKANLLGLDDEEVADSPGEEPGRTSKPEPILKSEGAAAAAAAAAASAPAGEGDGETSEERRARRKERKKRSKAKDGKSSQKGGKGDPQQQIVLFEEPGGGSFMDPGRAPLHSDDLIILPSSRLKTLRTEAMVDRAVERVKSSLRSATVDDVCDWLSALGLDHYVTTFSDNAVDGQLLAELGDEMLRDDLGVHKIGDRAKIRRARDAILSGQESSSGTVATGADAADGIISPEEEAKKSRRWLGHERIKVQARLSSTDPWLNMKISAGELGNDLEHFRTRLASTLQVHESALGHLEYMDTNGDWFACMNEYDVWDGVAEQGGRALVLQVVEARAPGFQVGEALDHDGRRSLVEVGPQPGLAGGMVGGGQSNDMKMSLDGSLGPSAEGGCGGNGRPESTEQLHLLMKALLRRGAVHDAVAELKAWLGARGQELTEQPYNTLLKLALDDKLPSSAATGILNSMEDDGVAPGVRSYQYVLRILVASGDLQDASDIIRKMERMGVKPDSAAYEQLVQGLAERGDVDMALMLAKQSTKAGTRLGINCLGFLLNACTQKKAKQQGLATFKLIKKAGLGLTAELFASVIKCACVAGDLELASSLLKDSIATRHTPGVLTFNAVLALCVEQNANHEAVRAFKRLQKAPAEADEESYALLLQCTSAAGELALSAKVLQEMVSLGFYPTILTCNQLLALCADQRSRTEAVAIFKYMQMSGAAGLSPNSQSYEHLIAVGVQVNDTQFVVQVVKHMVSAGFAPTAARASELLDVCAQNRGQGAQVLSLYKLMQSIALQAERLEGDPFPYSALIDCACIYEDLGLATQTLKIALQTRSNVDTGVVGSLIMESAQKDVREALELLRLLVATKKLPSREVIVYFLEQSQRQQLDVDIVQQMNSFFTVMRDRGFPLDGTLKETFHAMKISILGEDSDEEDAPEETTTKILLVDNEPLPFHVGDFGPRVANLRDCRAVWAEPKLAEGPLQNKRAINNSIAIVGRGVVPFVDKAQRCQKAGAVAVVIVNHDDSILECAGGEGEHEISIPVVCVTRTAGRAFSLSAATTVDLVFAEADSPPANTADNDDMSSVGRPEGSTISSALSSSSSGSSASGSSSSEGSSSRGGSSRRSGSSSGSSSARSTDTGSTNRNSESSGSRSSRPKYELNSDETESASGSSSASSGSSASTAKWMKAYDETRGRDYYYNDAGEVRWSKP